MGKAKNHVNDPPMTLGNMREPHRDAIQCNTITIYKAPIG